MAGYFVPAGHDWIQLATIQLATAAFAEKVTPAYLKLTMSESSQLWGSPAAWSGDTDRGKGSPTRTRGPGSSECRHAAQILTLGTVALYKGNGDTDAIIGRGTGHGALPPDSRESEPN